MALNLEAAMTACREAYLLMREQRAGGIVNIASIAAHGPGKWMGRRLRRRQGRPRQPDPKPRVRGRPLRHPRERRLARMVETDMTAVLPADTRQSLAIPMGRFRAAAGGRLRRRLLAF